MFEIIKCSFRNESKLYGNNLFYKLNIFFYGLNIGSEKKIVFFLDSN